MGVDYFESNVSALMYPFIDICWVCEREDILIAKDTSIDECICINCIEDAIFIDVIIQRAYGNRIHWRN